MKALITLVLIFGVYLLGKSIYDQYQAKQRKELAAQKGIPADGLTGMSPQFEASLNAAKAQGPAALKAWLQRYHGHIHDPKLADIQLDYVVLAGRSDPAEAKRVFNAVKARVPTNSPVYPRVKKLNSTFGH